jgi:radical SAM superfamily enzyme YgiQ (UPF0313 family)
VHVILTAIHPYPSPQAIPLANAFLKAYLATDEGLSASVAVTLQDFIADQDTSSCVSAILTGNPTAVGFSMYLWNRDKCRAIATGLRSVRPGLTLFAGGPEPTVDAEGVLAEAPYDFVIVGEGEIPFVEAMGRLTGGKSLHDVTGIAQRQPEGYYRPSTRVVPLLDTIPSPYLSRGGLDPARYGGILWQLSRGCDFTCDFCFDRQGTRPVRCFSLDRIEAELRFFVKKRVTQVFVLDSTFNRNRERAKAILRLIGRLAPHIHFHFEVRSEFIDAEMADLFARLTCSLQLGLQSADPEVNRKVGRRFDPAGFSGKVSLLDRAGAIYGFDLIYGLPGDTLKGYASSLDFALGLSPNHLDIFPLAVLPGTPLAANAGNLRLRYLQKPPYTLLGAPGFPPADMAKAAGLASACDIFYSRGRAVAWFNAVLAPLGLSPAAFLGKFRRWLDREHGGPTNETDLEDDDICLLQREFVRTLYSSRRLSRLLPAALDLMDYHAHYAAALLAPQAEIPTDRQLAQTDLLDERFVLAPGTRLARFNYEIFDILEAGDIDLREFAACFTPHGSAAAIYPRGDEVLTESLIEPYFLLLEQLDGTTRAGDIASGSGISEDEAVSFLEFAAAEGIICGKKS